MYVRVVAYVVRDGALLVFDHVDDPGAGTQVPAGTVEDGEDPADAVVREVLEECGVHAQVVRELGTTDRIAPRGEPRRNVFFLLTCDESRNEWEHIVAGGGSDDGLIFLCRFIALSEVPPLAGDEDFLDAL